MEIFFGIVIYLVGIIFFLGVFVVGLMCFAPYTFIELCMEFDTWWAKKRGWEIHEPQVKDKK
jgi:hypothetical protein